MLQKTFWEVSNPKSPYYARYMSREEIAAIVSPPSTVLEEIQGWLQREGHAKSIGLIATKDAIRAEIAVQDLEDLLQIKFQKFIRTTDGLNMHIHISILLQFKLFKLFKLLIINY